MAKRQIRISANMLAEKWSDFSGKKANIVLLNGSVIYASLKGLSSGNLEIVNMRLSTQNIKLDQISEIIIDHN